jgi:hypothetical protein
VDDDAHCHDWCTGRSLIRDDVRLRPRASANRDRELICRRKRQSTQSLRIAEYFWPCQKLVLRASRSEWTYFRPAIDNAASELFSRMQDRRPCFLTIEPARSLNAVQRIGRAGQ